MTYSPRINFTKVLQFDIILVQVVVEDKVTCFRYSSQIRDFQGSTVSQVKTVA